MEEGEGFFVYLFLSGSTVQISQLAETAVFVNRLMDGRMERRASLEYVAEAPLFTLCQESSSADDQLSPCSDPHSTLATAWEMMQRVYDE